MSQYRTSRVFDVIFVAILLFGLFMVYRNRVAVSDWAFFLVNQPKTESIQLADAAGLSDYGRKLLYRADPQITSRNVIAQQCDVEDIGCLTTHGTIYIEATDNHDEQAVTAAHEMLHLAYRRLNDKQRADVNNLIKQAIEQINSSFLEQELSNEKDEAGRLDEAHSLLGTEYSDLPDGLENYYKQYFSDRDKVLAAYQGSQE